MFSGTVLPRSNAFYFVVEHTADCVGEIFRPLIKAAASSCVVAHLHPSFGEPVPSPEDIMMTERLREAGELLGIPVVDHIVIGKGFLLFYRKNSDHFIRIERWDDKEAVAEEMEELVEDLEDQDAATEIGRVRVVLDKAIESIGFELKVSDAEGMGWPIRSEPRRGLLSGGMAWSQSTVRTVCSGTTPATLEEL